MGLILSYLAVLIKLYVSGQWGSRLVDSTSQTLMFMQVKDSGKKLSISLVTFRMQPTLKNTVKTFMFTFILTKQGSKSVLYGKKQNIERLKRGKCQGQKTPTCFSAAPQNQLHSTLSPESKHTFQKEVQSGLHTARKAVFPITVNTHVPERGSHSHMTTSWRKRTSFSLRNTTPLFVTAK